MAETSQERDEAQVIAFNLGGNTHAFHDLIRPHERSVYMMALSLLQNEADAEDAAQEAFLKAFRNLAKFRGEAKFGTWLISITLNEAPTRLRCKKGRKDGVSGRHTRGQESISPALLRDWREMAKHLFHGALWSFRAGF